MNKLHYQTKVYLPNGDQIQISKMRKRMLAGEEFSILGRYPNGVIAPSRVKSVESVLADQLWHVKVDDKRAVHATADTKLLAASFTRIDELVIKDTFLTLGPSAQFPTDGIKWALAGVLRPQHVDIHKAPSFYGLVTMRAKSGLSFGGDNRSMTIIMEDTDNFVTTSGIIVNGEDN